MRAKLALLLFFLFTSQARADAKISEIKIELDGLQVIGRAITPPQRVKRFDTRFFAIDRTAIAHEVEGIVGPDSELVELVWVTFRQARDLDLHHVTAAILTDLEARIANGFFHELPVPFYYQRRGHFVRELL